MAGLESKLCSGGGGDMGAIDSEFLLKLPIISRQSLFGIALK